MNNYVTIGDLRIRASQYEEWTKVVDVNSEAAALMRALQEADPQGENLEEVWKTVAQQQFPDGGHSVETVFARTRLFWYLGDELWKLFAFDLGIEEAG